MNWYYAEGEKTVGPLTIDTMRQLHSCGMVIAETLVAREGSQQWTTYAEAFKAMPGPPPVPGAPPSVPVSAWSRVATGVSSAAGLEKLDGNAAKSVFSGALKNKTVEELEEVFAVGTQRTTPPLASVSAAWPTPWVFMRLLMFSVIATVGFYWALTRFDNPNLYPGWLFMGAFAVPFSVMVFFLETNVLHNVSFHRVLKSFFMGGLLSLIFANTLFESTAAAEHFGAVSAGPIEELAKILAVVFIARTWGHLKWTLNGMLLGAAVGAGFAAFETAGYILGYAMDGVSTSETMIMRACTAPFTHVIWTAASAAALWKHKGGKAFTPAMLIHGPVLRVLLFVMALHAIWNSSLTVPFVGGLTAIGLKSLILGIIGWILVLLLIQSGLNQVKAAQSTEQAIPPLP